MRSQRIRSGVLVLSMMGISGACAQFSGPPAGTEAGTGGAPAGSGGAGPSSGGASAGGASTGGAGLAAPGSGGRTAGTGGAPRTGGSGAPGSGGAGGTPAGVITGVDLNGKKVLFIVDDPASLDDGDIMVRDMMTARGMVVTMAGTAASAPGAAAQDLIVGSSGAAAAELATLYKSLPVPLLTFANGYYQPLDFIATTAARGNAPSTSTLTVVDGTSHLSAGFAAGASLAVINPTRNTQIYWATPAGAPLRIAQVTGNPAQLCAFAYEKGAMMATTAAPARRVSLGWRTDAIKDLAVDSFRLMNAAIEWAAANL